MSDECVTRAEKFANHMNTDAELRGNDFETVFEVLKKREFRIYLEKITFGIGGSVYSIKFIDSIAIHHNGCWGSQ